MPWATMHDRRTLLQIAPADGWRAKFKDDNSEWTEPLASWVLVAWRHTPHCHEDHAGQSEGQEVIGLVAIDTGSLDLVDMAADFWLAKFIGYEHDET